MSDFTQATQYLSYSGNVFGMCRAPVWNDTKTVQDFQCFITPQNSPRPLEILTIAIENGHGNSDFSWLFPLDMVIFHRWNYRYGPPPVFRWSSSTPSSTAAQPSTCAAWPRARPKWISRQWRSGQLGDGDLMGYQETTRPQVRIRYIVWYTQYRNIFII